VHASSGHADMGLEMQERALSIHRDLGDRTGEAFTLNNTAYTYLELGRDDSETRTHRALALFNLDRPEEAAADARLAVDLGHKDAWPRLILGWIAASEEDYRGAMAHFRAALAADRKNYHALSNIGRCYTELGDFNKASDFIDRALKAEPYDAYSHYALSLWFERQDMPGEALWTCLNAALTCPADTRLMEKISELIAKGVTPAEPD
ncbi:MAG: tetratricopeptide repeat protein, partial [Elusimicrobiales bacterium]|nr:tetratricopeptide repeat protein [Elusimicrobiales bacterium]